MTDQATHLHKLHVSDLELINGIFGVKLPGTDGIVGLYLEEDDGTFRLLAEFHQSHLGDLMSVADNAADVLEAHVGDQNG